MAELIVQCSRCKYQYDVPDPDEECPDCHAKGSWTVQRVTDEGKAYLVRMELPKNLHDFLRDVTMLSDLDVEQYIVDCIKAQIFADLDEVSDTSFWNAEGLKAKYGLAEDC